MILLIALPTLLIYLVVLALTMGHLRAAGRREVERFTTRLAANYAARFDGAFRATAAIAPSTAHFLERVPDLTERQLLDQLRANTLQDPLVYGAAIAFEPGAYRTDDSLFCPYVHRGGGGLVEMNITRDVYDWYGDESWQWWHLPRASGRAAWTDPYFDEGAGNVLMVTYSAPFFRDGKFRGVTTVDVMLPNLQQSMGQEIQSDLDFVILTGRGQFVFHRDPALIMNRTIYEVADALGRPDLAEVGRRVLSGEPGVAAADGWDAPGRQWIFFAPIRSTGWSFAARVPEREALAGVRALVTSAGAALLASLVLIVACIWHVSGRLSRPIERLRTSVLQIAGGDLEARVEGITGSDEIGELARSFNQMSGDLRSHIDRLAEERAGREKIERELDITREIQRGLLPRGEPRAPGFQVAGWNQAADKTGGDYFDWLELPDGRTVVTLADVTGHGIGPALIMAVCRAYMRASTSDDSVVLTDAISRVNNLLHADLPQGRFVTAAVGIIDPRAGAMALVSAGQAPILFYEARTGTVTNWPADDLPLGVVNGMRLESPRQIRFSPGDILLLTTDGFMEWPDSNGRNFGTKRLEEFLRANHQLAPSEFIAQLYQSVRAHGAGVTQGDDLTALVIKRAQG
jgi:phosphoserine phosphatase RsbU/P